MADLSSILGGMVQGFKDFGTGLVDMFGTGGAAIGDLFQSGGRSTKNQDDFRKWLYQTDNTQDAAAKGLGTILNGVQTVSDFIPGAGAVTRNPLFNGVQGAIGGVADEFKMAGKDYDLGRAAQRAGVGAASGLASAYTNQALGKTGNKLINNGLVRGAAGGALAGGIANAGYTGIDGGSVQDMINAGLYGARTGALVGGATGLARELIKPTHKMDVALSEDERKARIANIDDQLAKLDTSTQEGIDRHNELMMARIKYEQPQDYMMSHRPTKSGIYADDLLAEGEDGLSYPKDVYDKPQNYTFMYTDTPDVMNETMAQLNAVRGNPNGEVTIYRATPGNTINDGDWITLSESYAKLHNDTQLDGKGNVLSQKVNVRDIQPAMDDLAEWGYFPQKKAPTNVADLMVESKPKTYYHGSPETDITEFDINRAGKNTRSGEKAIYFTDTPEAAEEFAYERIPTDSNFIDKAGKRGGVYEANLDIRNTLDLDNLTDAQIKELWPYASNMGSWQGEDVFARDIKHWRDVKNPQLIKGYLDLEKLANSPYDSLSATMYPNTGNKAKEYAIFDASKAKITKSPKTVADLMLSPDDDAMYSKVAEPIEVRQDSSLLDDKRKRALDLITHKDTPAANELYDRIDPSTLPAGYDKLRKLLDTNIVDETLEQKLGKHPLRADADELLDYLYPNEPLEKKVYHKSLKESIEKYKKDAAALGVDAKKAAEDMTRNKRYELVQKAYEKAKFDAIADVGNGIDVGDDIIYATQDIRHRGIRTGYPAALDTALSERLGIAPGNTIKVTDSAYDYIDKEFRNKNVGRYANQPKDIAIREGILGIEGDISAMAHERLHSFQNEAKPENAGRYSKEVADAYNQLSKDLEPFIKSDEEIKRLYKNKDTEYYAKKNEQESRMLQAYLDNNKITQDAQYWHNKSIGGQPEWGNEINPAFDKFFKKLRALSKKGVALPALTALFGGGAIAGALTSGKDDKKKKSEVK